MTFKKKIKNYLGKLSTKLDVRLNPNKYRVGDYYCPVCASRIRYFNQLPAKNLISLDENGFRFSLNQFETLNILNYKCSKCDATDRDRLYALFLSQKIDRSSTLSFLDIAPRKGLSKFLRGFSNLRYRTADLYMHQVDDKVDITDMKIYTENKFDLVLCSHVFEHVEEDEKAMNEFYRILKVGGLGIFMVPIMLSLSEDYQPAGIESEADRWKHFGQGDHVRMYSKKGFIEKLKKAGFVVQCLGIEYFGKDVFNRCGISPRSVLYIGLKQ